MNHLVFLDAQAGELEKILSGTKRMLVREPDPARPACQPLCPGDSLYFLREKDQCILRVKATVVRVRLVTSQMDNDLVHALKELQPRLQLTEDQYNYWSGKKQVILVEFAAAQKIDAIQIDPMKAASRSNWIAFEDFSRIT